ncbi:MAG: hypothetical protein ACKOOG_01230 [Actinomycetota bacterium]
MGAGTGSENTVDAEPSGQRALGSQFVGHLANRDFDAISMLLAPKVRMRGLVPSGPAEWNGRQEVTAAFASWFGAADDFEIGHTEIDEIAGRLHLAWRAQVQPAPYEGGDGRHVIEQHFLADIPDSTDAIEALDFLCTGFRRASTAPDDGA